MDGHVPGKSLGRHWEVTGASRGLKSLGRHWKSWGSHWDVAGKSRGRHFMDNRTDAHGCPWVVGWTVMDILLQILARIVAIATNANNTREL